MNSLHDNWRLPDICLARSLNERIPSLMKKVDRLRPNNDFDTLVAREYFNSLLTQREFIQFIFFKNYNDDCGVEIFLDFMFGEPKEREAGHVLMELEDMVRAIDWKQYSKRSDLMFYIDCMKINSEYTRIKSRIEGDFTKVRSVLNHYFEEMGFITREQAEILDKLILLRDIDETISVVQSSFKMPFSKIPDYLRERIFQNKGLSEQEYTGLAEQRDEFLAYDDMMDLFYDLDHVADGGEWAEDKKQMELGRSDFVYYRDEEHKIKLFAGDILRIAGHEGLHRLRSVLSRYMPLGLNGSFGEDGITRLIMDEGLAMYFQNSFLDYVAEKKPLNLSKQDIKRAKSKAYNAKTFRLVSFLYSVYHRLANKEDRDIDAAAMLAKVTKNQALSDPMYLGPDAIHKTIEDTFYIYGLPVVERMMERLVKEKTREKGNRRNARHHIKRNNRIYMTGFFTGLWGPSTIEEFYFDHYLPRVEKLDILK